MIITAAIMKGGVGKSTLVRVLSSVAAHRGYEVTIIDADVRMNLTRWVSLLNDAGRKPDNLNIITTNDDDKIHDLSQEYDSDNSVVFIDTEGTTNDAMMAGLFAADIVLVPTVYSPDEVAAAVQLVNNYVPQVNEERDSDNLTALFVETKRNLIESRAGALKEVREIIHETRTPVANAGLWERVTYKDLQSGTTLYNAPKIDQKAILESEALFDEVVERLFALSN